VQNEVFATRGITKKRLQSASDDPDIRNFTRIERSCIEMLLNCSGKISISNEDGLLDQFCSTTSNNLNMIRRLTKLYILVIFLSACRSSGNECNRFFVYETKTVNIKAISASLKAEGIPIKISVGEIAIKPEFERASDKLKELDLLQFTLCNQISVMPDTDSSKSFARLDYVKTLQDMLRIAQRPDTNLDIKVKKLEKTTIETNKSVDTIKSDLVLKNKDIEKLKKEEDNRKKGIKQDSILKSIPPKVYPYLVLERDNTIYLHLNFINKVPTNIDFYINRLGSDETLSGILMSRPTIYPTEKEVIASTHINLQSGRLSKDTLSKITLRFAYQSIYYMPPNNVDKYAIDIDYLIDPARNSITEIDRRNTIIKGPVK
jgi:hypothetical protein